MVMGAARQTSPDKATRAARNPSRPEMVGPPSLTDSVIYYAGRTGCGTSRLFTGSFCQKTTRWTIQPLILNLTPHENPTPLPNNPPASQDRDRFALFPQVLVLQSVYTRMPRLSLIGTPFAFG